MLRRFGFAILLLALGTGTRAFAQTKTLPMPARVEQAPLVELPASARPIDLETALRLADVANPQIRLARERVLEAVAARQLAAAQFLPNLNYGTNYDLHLGNLQDSQGNIVQVNRNSLYVGLGAGAIGAGTVNIPGIVWNANVADVWYGNLVSKQVVRQRRFENEAVRNDMLLRVATAYMELLRASGRHAVAAEIRKDAQEVARVTGNFAKTGQGRQSDADRAATELQQRDADLVQAVGDIELASARLNQLLSLDPSVKLVPMEQHVVPGALVPEPIPLPELIAIAVTQRPELRERQAAVRVALLQMRQMKMLPFSPTALVGYSAGAFGGGSDVSAAAGQPRFGDFNNRSDFDVVLFWTLRNLGVGNAALINLSRSRMRQSELRELETFDRVRAEVASARARLLARGDQIDLYEKAVQSSRTAFKQDLARVFNDKGLPIELLDSLRLSGRSRYGYLDSIVDYNRAQFELYVALGQPPADTLARPVPLMLGAPEPTPMPLKKLP
ncbi:MAG TPA: TolC family protein [Gemmataceae bacterium]|nr:TolC family protein [Gemmataceae bacterium]